MGPTVEFRGISKLFGSLPALQDVDLTVTPGGIHAIVGENGAGKTTLMRILYGALKPDSGRIVIGDVPRSFRDSGDAIAVGVGMVSQHSSVIPELTCLDNLILGDEGGRIINRRQAVEKATALAESMAFKIDWPAPASTLSPVGVQRLEILRLLWRNASIMILDEPTAMLPPADSAALFRSLEGLAEGGATILLVTHRLPEVLAYCSRATVLRHGQVVATERVIDTSSAELAELIVGHSPAPPGPKEQPPSGAAPALEISRLTVAAEADTRSIDVPALKVGVGEIVGIAGVDGSGQRELFLAIAGPRAVEAGSIRFEGSEVTKWSARQRIQAGLRQIPEDRHLEGMIESWPLSENAALGLQRTAPFARAKWVDVDGRKRAAVEIADRLGTRYSGMDQPMSDLSGGNQQRFVISRALFGQPRLILAFQPARGLDIEAIANVYRAMREECAAGAAALVVSFDLDELLENCDRVVAMYRGSLREPPLGRHLDRAAIGSLMVGAQ